MSGTPSVRLGDCCEIVSGATPKTSIAKYWGGDIAWATPKDLSNSASKHITSTPQTLTEAGYRSCSAKIMPPGSVLFSSRAPIGHVAINTLPMCTNQGFKSLVPDPAQVSPDYLYYWLKANKTYLQSLGNGATFKEVSKATVADVRIPLPSLSEQRRIAAILDKADALRAKRREAIAKLDQLLQSVFLDMFGDPVCNPKNWPDTHVLGDVADIASGITKGRRTQSATRDVPYLAVSNVQERALKLDVVKRIAATDDEIERYRLLPDDLLLTEGGDPDKLGRGALWRGELSECIHQNHVFRVRLTTDLLQPVYLSWLVGSERGKRYFAKQAKQTTGIASINMRQLRAFPLLVPPADLQRRFGEVATFIGAEKARLEQHANLLGSLFASLQHRAFSGTL